MRKLTLEIELNEEIQEELKSFFKYIHSWELLETLKTEWEEGIYVGLGECLSKEDISIHDLKHIGNMEILSVLKSEGNKHTCLVKYQEPEISKELFKEFDLDLITATPTILTEKKYTCSVIGDQNNLTRFIELMKTNLGKIETMSFKRAAFQKHDILSVLTAQQREIIIAAEKHGFFKYPRKIKPEELAKIIGISKGTTLEHLRKAEDRLMTNIVAGY
jgi:DNA-binding MarR family transcriptional regulator